MNEQTIDAEQQFLSEDEIEEPAKTVADVIKPLDDNVDEFDFWQDLKDSMPPWINEVVGFALTVFGILSFISLYIASDALVAVSWADMLAAIAGDGAVFVAGILFALGVVLWLPKAGVQLRLSPARLLALEIIFLSALAILHLGNSDSELRALARAGQGGGLIGWGISYPLYWIMGRQAALVFFAALIAVGAIVAVGLRRRHIVAVLARFGMRLQTFSEEARQAPSGAADDMTQNLYKRLAEAPDYRTGIMRIRQERASPPADASNDGQSAAAPANSLARIRHPASVNGDAPASAPDEAPEAVSAPADSETADQSSPGSSSLEAAGEQDVELAADEPATPAPGPPLWPGALPSIECLTSADLVMPDEEEINHNAMLIRNTLLEFDLETTVVEVQVGPTVTRYALQPHREDGSERIRMSKIASYARDLSLALAAKRLRLETPVPGTNYMGIEVPNKEPALVALRNLLASDEYQEEKRRNRAPLLIPLGRDVRGQAVSLDLSQMPHLLIAGTTGSGKSVCMAAIATALLMQYAPDHLQMVMLDPKMVELTRFDGIPHLVGPVEIEHERIIGVLRWCAQEMDRRYKLLEAQAARNIVMYNEKQLLRGAEAEPLPYLVILIDEVGDLMLSNPEETERSITRMAQMARAVGMHMVIATQRPSVNVITGLIKANFPARIAFSVASGADSRVIIDRTGAEDLLGSGDMLFLSADAAGPRRVQGCFISEDDVRVVVQHWKDENERLADQAGAEAQSSNPWEAGLNRQQFLKETDPMLEDVLRLIVDVGEASASLIQRRLGLGYPRAARIMDLLESLGVVGEELGGGRSRKVIIPPGDDPLRHLLREQREEN